MLVCKSCKGPIKKGQQFCPECGTAVLPEALFNNGEPGGINEYTSKEEASPATGHKTARCPLCGTAYPLSASYCEKDGTPLSKVESYMLPDLNRENAPKQGVETAGRKGFSGVKWFIGAFLLSLGGVLIYLYLAISSSNAVRVEEGLNRALKTRGFDVAAKVGRDNSVNVTGTVQSNSDKKAALAIIGSHREVKKVIDNIQVRPSQVDIENDLNEAFYNQGITGVQAQVDEDFTAVLTGRVDNQQKKIEAARIVTSYEDVKRLLNNIRVERPAASLKNEGDTIRLVETRNFRLSALSPSSWASMKYRDSTTFQVPGPGRALIEGEWQSQAALALILSRADSGTTYAQKDGRSPLRVVYRVTSQDLAQGAEWEATVANFSPEGPVEGHLKVTFIREEPVKTGTQPREKPFDTARLQKDINSALREAGLQGVTAEVASDRSVRLKGSVKNVEEKLKAFGIAGKFKSIKAVKDIIFVVGS